MTLVVKTQCAIPALDFLPCEALPMLSDLCPSMNIRFNLRTNFDLFSIDLANQAYGSFLSRGQTGKSINIERIVFSYTYCSTTSSTKCISSSNDASSRESISFILESFYCQSN